MSQELFSSIWSQEPWTLFVQDHLDKFLDLTTSFLVRKGSFCPDIFSRHDVIYREWRYFEMGTRRVHMTDCTLKKEALFSECPE